jgi:flavin reductase (DIM6/NTAB) family NADH-FMN oxidoreductase RutF
MNRISVQTSRNSSDPGPAATIDARAFRHTVGRFATGVTVIATEVNGQHRAMTANSFTSVSLDPPLVLFCVGKQATMGSLIRETSSFSISILTKEQQNVATYFASSARDADAPPERLVAWEGTLRLQRCAAALACAVDRIEEGGDHWIVIGRVRALYCPNEALAPLIFSSGHYV